MVELMTVLTIIVILITILVPVVGKVRKTANVAAVQQQISAIAAAIDRYQQTFNALPGPLADNQLYNLANQPTNPNITDANGSITHISGAENLVLGLMGGLRPLNPAANPPTYFFDRALVGTGPRGLNPANPKKYEPFIDNVPLTQRPDTLNTAPNYGKYKDAAGEADDSDIPEILDRYGSNPMPILYLRSTNGAGGVVSIGGQDINGGVMSNAAPFPPTQYDINQILPYTKCSTGSIGEGKTINIKDYTTGNAPQQPKVGLLPHGLQSVNQGAALDKNGIGGANAYQYPYDAFPYFVNRAIAPTDTNFPNKTGTPKQQNKYILISAGPDRVYGTADDITNFGNVTE